MNRDRDAHRIEARRHRPDYGLVLLSGILLSIGMIVIYSIGPALATSSGITVGKQFIVILIGILAFMTAAFLPLTFWSHAQKRLMYIAIGASLLLFILPFIWPDNPIRSMMNRVIQAGGGAVAKREGYEIGGKTGTAQVLDENGVYSKDREIGSFMGFVGSVDPEYVIMTRVEEPGIPGYAGTVAAAPIFADISNWLIDYYQIPPR